MKQPPRFAGLRRLFRLPSSPAQIDCDVYTELQFHLDSRIAELVAQGLPADEAARTARQEFGDVGASRAELAAIRRRSVAREHRADLFDVLCQDLTYAVRGLLRQPALALAIIITLGLGVGANAAVFTMLDRVFLQAPPGIANPGSVRRLYAHKLSKHDPQNGPNGTMTPFLTTRDLLDLSAGTNGAAQVVGGYLYPRGLLPGNVRVFLTFVSPGYFNLFGVRASRGRLFTADEERLPGPPVPVVVISDAFRRSHFGDEARVIGDTIRVDETVYTIVGVAARQFEGTELQVTDMWTPLSNVEGGMITSLRVFARPSRGTSRLALDNMFTAQYRKTHVGDPLVEDSSAIVSASVLAPLGPTLTGVSVSLVPGMSSQSTALLARLGGVGIIVLIISVANVASLLLMRAMRRRREIAIRIALGISQARLVGQLIVESTLLAMIAGAVALLIASLTGNALRVQLSSFRWTETIVDQRVVLFAMAMAILGGAIAGLAPAALGMRTDVVSSLKASSSGATYGAPAIRTALLVTQAALCMALLICAGAFLKNLRGADEFDRGFDPGHAIYLSVPAYYANSETQIHDIADRLRNDPGIESVGRSFGLTGVGMRSKIGPTGSDTVGESPRGPFIEFVDHDFMNAAAFRALSGRTFAESDDFAPVVVISNGLAKALFHGQNAVGRCVHVREPASPCREIIGVVQDYVWNITEQPFYRAYIPLPQAWRRPPTALIPNSLTIRMRAPATSADVARLRGIVTPMISQTATLNVQRVTDMLEPQLHPSRLAARLFLVLGLLGLAAAAAGIYGLVAYDAAQRARELGIRIALGATAGHIFGSVVMPGLRIVSIGVGAGTVVGLIAGRVMSSLLFATSPYDPVVFVVTAATLCAATLLASVIPAWRATRTDPLRVLSAD